MPCAQGAIFIYLILWSQLGSADPRSLGLQPIALDIGNAQTPGYYDWLESIWINRHTPRPGFIYNLVREGTNGLHCRSSGVIWQAKDETEYSKKVEVIRYPDPRVKELNIFLENGIRKKFVSNSKIPWTEVKPSEIIPTMIYVSYPYDSFSYQKTYSGNVSTFIAKENFRFRGIREQNDALSRSSLIWSTNNPEEYASKVVTDACQPYDKTKNIIIFQENGTIKHLVRDNDRWVEIDPSGTLDISTKENSIDYHYSEDKGKGTRTYTGRGNFRFTSVQESTGSSCSTSVTDIWSAKTKNEYAKKVIVREANVGQSYLIIFILDGTLRIYYKVAKNEPWRHDTKGLTLSTLEKMGVIEKGYGKTTTQKASAETSKKEQPKPSPRQPQKVSKEIQTVPPSQPTHTSQPPPTIEILPLPVTRSHIPRASGPRVVTIVTTNTIAHPSSTTATGHPCSPTSTIPRPRRRLKLIHLDIRETGGTGKFKAYIRGNKVTFIPGQDYLFKTASKGERVLWQATGLNYSDMIVVEALENGRSRLIPYITPLKVTRVLKR